MKKVGVCLLPFAFFLLPCLSGCGRRGNVDLLEARLRQQEERLADLRSELETTTAELAVVRHEANSVRAQLARRGEKTILPEQAGVLYRAAGIRFNKLLTGGRDGDDIPGDELLHAVLVPHDADGELLKLPGRIELTVSDPAKPDGQQRIGAWEFSADQSRQHWHRGFIGSGYVFQLPWRQAPESAELLLHARLTTPDGRQFDASRIIHITPPSETSDLALGGPSEEPASASDKAGQPLPFPRIGDEQTFEPQQTEGNVGDPTEESSGRRTSERGTEKPMPEEPLTER